jgi:hypothetical protein
VSTEPSVPPRRPRPWQVAQLTRVDVVRLTWLLWAVALIRGADYATGNDGSWPAPIAVPLGQAPPSALVGIEAAFPLWVWAAMIITSCAVLLLGMLRRWHAWVWAGHVALSAIYLGLSVGLLVGYLDRPWFDGVRNSTGLLVAMALHALLWWRMGPAPVTPPTAPDASSSTGAAHG